MRTRQSIYTPFFVFHDRDGLYSEIMKAQDRIPHMALFREPSQNHILMDTAPGQLIWHLENAPDPTLVERQLIEFVEGANGNGFSHQDIRPWNVFADEQSRITVIDWGNSRRVKNNVDAEDVAGFVKFLRLEVTPREAWGWHPHWHPAWCKRD